MGDGVFGRNATHAAGIGTDAGAVISTWNLIGMCTTISVATWDVVRQGLFPAALAGIVASPGSSVSSDWWRWVRSWAGLQRTLGHVARPDLLGS